MIICDSLGLLIVTDFIFLKNIFFFYLQCIISWCIVQRNTLTYYFHRFSKPRKCFAFCVIWRSLRRVTSFCDTLKLCPFHCVPPLHTRSSCAHSQLPCTLAAPVHTLSGHVLQPDPLALFRFPLLYRLAAVQLCSLQSKVSLGKFLPAIIFISILTC